MTVNFVLQCRYVRLNGFGLVIMIFSCMVLATKKLCGILSVGKKWSSIGGFSRTFRTISTSSRFYSSTELNKPLKQWTLVVDPYSTVRVQLRCNISVQPLDPHAFPEANRAFITVSGTSADQGLKLDNFHVQYDDKNKELLILSEKVNSNVSVELTTPIKSDLYITTLGEGNVKIQKMECDTCRVLTEIGNCVLKSVKSQKVLVQSVGGDIICLGTVHGNVDISTSGNSMVSIKKLQGSSMNVTTEHGPLKVKAIYAESISVSSTSGNIVLGHLHGNATVRSKVGDVVVDGSNGYLKVFSQKGDIDAYVGEQGTAELLAEQGGISVRVPASMRADVLLAGASVEVSPEITLHKVEQESTDSYTTLTALLNGEAEGGQWIKAQTETGTVSLRTQSWFESLKLGN